MQSFLMKQAKNIKRYVEKLSCLKLAYFNIIIIYFKTEQNLTRSKLIKQLHVHKVTLSNRMSFRMDLKHGYWAG